MLLDNVHPLPWRNLRQLPPTCSRMTPLIHKFKACTVQVFPAREDELTHSEVIGVLQIRCALQLPIFVS